MEHRETFGQEKHVPRGTNTNNKKRKTKLVFLFCSSWNTYFFCCFAQVSLRVTVRLNTMCSGVESLSTQK